METSSEREEGNQFRSTVALLGELRRNVLMSELCERCTMIAFFFFWIYGKSLNSRYNFQ